MYKGDNPSTREYELKQLSQLSSRSHINNLRFLKQNPFVLFLKTILLVIGICVVFFFIGWFLLYLIGY